MVATSLFLISSLALLALSSADNCGYGWTGDRHGTPSVLGKITVQPGPVILYIPEVCSAYGMVEVGAEMTVCSAMEPTPTVKFMEPTKVLINTQSVATVSTTVYCRSYRKSGREAGDYQQIPINQ